MVERTASPWCSPMSTIPEKRSKPEDPDIKDLIDGAASVDVVTNETFKRHLEFLQQCFLINQDHRNKFATTPEKFMESEMELVEELERFRTVATDPSLIPLLNSSSDWLHIMLDLLDHPNTDVTEKVVSLLDEVSEIDETMTVEDLENLKDLFKNFIQQHLMSKLLTNVKRYGNGEVEGISETLEMIENLADLDPMLLDDIDWKDWSNYLADLLYDRSSASSVTRQYGAELTAILLRASAKFKSSFLSDPYGLDKVLASMAHFKATGDPQDADEIEYFENLFDIICDSVLDTAGLDNFLTCSGIDLMLMLLTEKTMCRIRAIKVISFSLSNPSTTGNVADIIVESNGLRILSPILLRQGERSLQKAFPKYFSPAQDVEFICSIVISLLRFCKPENLNRVISKLSDKLEDRLGRLIDLHRIYASSPSEEAIYALEQVHLMCCHLRKHFPEIIVEPDVITAINTTILTLAEDTNEQEQAYLKSLLLQ